MPRMFFLTLIILCLLFLCFLQLVNKRMKGEKLRQLKMKTACFHCFIMFCKKANGTDFPKINIGKYEAPWSEFPGRKKNKTKPKTLPSTWQEKEKSGRTYIDYLKMSGPSKHYGTCKTISLCCRDF